MRRWIVLAVIGLVLPASIPAAEAKYRLNLVRAGTCGRSCPIDTLTRGVIEVSESQKPGAGGLVGRIRIRGALKDGHVADAQNLLVILPFEKEGVCTDFVLKDVFIQNGKESLAFTGADIPGLVTLRAGTVLPLCGEVRVQPADAQGYDPILTGGFVLGTRGRDSRSRGILHMDLVPPPECGADCAIDHVKRATVELSNARANEGGGLAAKIDIRGARKAGRKIDLPGLQLAFAFFPNDVRDLLGSGRPGHRDRRWAYGSECTGTGGRHHDAPRPRYDRLVVRKRGVVLGGF